MKFLRYVHSAYSAIMFSVVFLVLAPIFFILIQNKSWHKAALQLNRIWARTFFMLSLIPVQQVKKFKPVSGRRYVFCPNHTSYIDIPAVGMIPHSFSFVGKNDMEKVPLFGYMYRKLHITVNRESIISSYKSYQNASIAVDEGKSLVIFPEGGIKTKEPPKLARFKDGAFRIAIEKQIPVIPVTIPYNWIILPDDGKFLLRWKRIKVIYHPPIETEGLTLDDLPALKSDTYQVIEKELRNHFPEIFAEQPHEN